MFASWYSCGLERAKGTSKPNEELTNFTNSENSDEEVELLKH